MTYIVTDTLFVGNLCLGQAAGIPSEIGNFIRRYADGIPSEIRNTRMACGDERICSICWYGAAEIHPVRQVTLQTRLRLPYWPNTESFRAFISDRIVLVDMHVCRNCVQLVSSQHVPTCQYIVTESCMLDGSPPNLLRRSRARFCCCWKKASTACVV